MAIVGMNCWPFVFNVTRDAASAPIWKTHALPNSGMKGVGWMKDFSLGSLAQLGFAHLLNVSELHPSVRKRSQLYSVPRPGRHLCIIEPNPSTHL